MDRDRERDAEEEPAPASKAGLVLAKLKIAGRYAVLAAPAVAVSALVVAVIAVSNNQSGAGQAKLSELTAKVDNLNASLSAAKSDLDTLKLAMAHERAMHAEERKKEDMQDEKIVQSVTRLQVKLKVTPTLESQLREMASAPAISPSVASAASSPVVAPVTAAAGKQAVAAQPAPKVADGKTAAEKPKPGPAGKRAAVAPSRSQSTDKTPDQVKALKEAIEKFNK